MDVSRQCYLFIFFVCISCVSAIPRRLESHNAEGSALDKEDLKRFLRILKHDDYTDKTLETANKYAEEDNDNRRQLDVGDDDDDDDDDYKRQLDDGDEDEEEDTSEENENMTERQMENDQLQNSDDWEDNEDEEEEKRTVNDQSFVDITHLDPDSDQANEISSQLIFKNGRSHKPYGIDAIFSHNSRAIEGQLDRAPPVSKSIGDRQHDYRSMGKRNFKVNEDRLWKDGKVPYVINSNLGTNHAFVNIIETAIKIMSDLTCVKFVPKDASQTSYVEFTDGTGCWSYVGQITGKQGIGLQAPWCVTVPITLHEMCHAIGQYHEQSRDDRDEYVTVRFENIADGTNNVNFRKQKTADVNPYDVDSTLQYGLYSFATNGKQTIELKDKRLEFLTRDSANLTFYDVEDITAAYKCADKCTSPPSCQNGGFVNHKCECYCPSGLTGNYCETPASDSDCGGIITLSSGEKRTILSPNYPQNYPLNKHCVWLIKAPSTDHIKVTIEDLELSSGQTCHHTLEIKYNLIGQRGIEICGSTNDTSYTTSNDSRSMMMLRFSSHSSSNIAALKGFNLTVMSLGTGAGTSAPTTTTTAATPAPTTSMATPSPTTTRVTTISPTTTSASTNSPVTQSPSSKLECDFEQGSTCFMSNVQGNDNFDWTEHSGQTPSRNTGPTSAYSGQTYLYAEMSSPRKTGDTAVFKTNAQLSIMNRCLKFAYHMYGSRNTGTLNVYGSGHLLWKKAGRQANKWLKAMISIPAQHGGVISIEAVRSTSWRGDIAIDDIELTEGNCDTVLDRKCSFEVGTNCFLVQDTENDNFDWTSKSGGTPSRATGPSAAIEGDRYIFIEASRPRQQGDIARLNSSIPFEDGHHCLMFNYHMYGKGIGSLDFYVKENGEMKQMYGISGDQGMFWIVDEVPIPSLKDKQLIIEGVRGKNFKGDIALDDVEIRKGPCSSCHDHFCKNGGTCTLSSTDPAGYTCSCQSGYTGPACEVLADAMQICSFDISCFMKNIKGDDFDWLLGEKTSSKRTGPTAMHDGKFGYIEASRPRVKGDRAILSTQGIIMDNRPRCLTFFYHMYGSGIGSLSVLSGPEGNKQERWKKSGDQGDEWKEGEVTIPAASNVAIDLVGVRGDSFRGDIAVDDIALFSGECPGQI